MCLYPRLINNKKYVSNKKNGGIIPPLPLLYIKEENRIIQDKRVLLVPVGCGKCMECKKQKARTWQVRLHEEIKHDKTGKFITLTFSNNSIKELANNIEHYTGYELDNAIATLGVRRFLERWRKKHKKSVKHWLVTELGGNGTENIHIHGIIWTDKENEEISRQWRYGSITIGKRKYIAGKAIDDNTTGWVNEQSINYIVKYINKIDEKHKTYNSKMLTSAGIGKKYIERIDSKNNKYKGTETNETYKTRQGAKVALPIYYRNKIYTDEEREQLWLDKLDKNERYVNGIKCKTDKEYYNALKNARDLNKELGYGDDTINWDLKKYEQQRRNELTLKRIKNVK